MPRGAIAWRIGLLLAVAGCHASAPSTRDRLERCPVEIAQGPLADARCTTLRVPEDRSAPQGRQIDLHVVVVPSRATPPAPSAFTLLAGGPGQAATDVAAQLLPLLDDVLAQHDVVLVDQRGTGRSAPIDCDETPSATLAELVKVEVDLDEVRECLADNEADLRQYITPVAADDLDAVREHLGYAKLDIWGGSYGTRVALVYARQYPERVRTMVLDGVAPPDMAMPKTMAHDGERALEKLFAACEADASCRQAFPQLRDDTRQLAQRLRRRPDRVTLEHPRTGATETVTIGSTIFGSAIRMLLYSPDTVAMLPFLLSRAITGDYAPLVARFDAAAPFGASMNQGMHMSVVCSEDFPRPVPAHVSTDDLPPPDQRVFDPQEFDHVYEQVCALWPKAVLPATYYEPVFADVPTLVLSGELDPVTPVAWAEHGTRELPTALRVTVPGAAHNTILSRCVADLITDLVDTGRLDGLDPACVDNNQTRPFFLHATGPFADLPTP